MFVSLSSYYSYRMYGLYNHNGSRTYKIE